MGTSASSKGPVGGVPMVPPWVPDMPQATPASDGDTPVPANGDSNQPGQTAAQPAQATPAKPVLPVPIAPSGRFRGARRHLGNFARGGDSHDMRRGVSDYVRKGYDGRTTAVRRFGGTVSTANALHGVLSGVAGGQTGVGTGSPLDRTVLAGSSAREVMDAVVEAVRPADGTLDGEASRYAIKDALSELLTAYPDADLLNLTEDQRTLAVERFTAIDVYRRFALDIGKTVRDKAPTAAAGLSRLKEVKDYIKQSVSAAFRKLKTGGQTLTTGRVHSVVRAALDDSFRVFEEYV